MTRQRWYVMSLSIICLALYGFVIYAYGKDALLYGAVGFPLAYVAFPFQEWVQEKLGAWNKRRNEWRPNDL